METRIHGSEQNIKDILREIEESYRRRIALSQSSQSRAAVLKVKGVSFNYVQFLWSGIGQVRQAQQATKYSEAMRIIIELIDYLPNSIKDEFQKRATMISNTMSLIRGSKIDCLRKVPDFYIRGIFKNRILQMYCQKALASFVDELSTKLQSMGYLENVEHIEEGQDDWYLEQKKEQAERKRRATREANKNMTKEARKFETVPEG
jgi:hypothetical protein